jgi:hypothetical protein
VAAEAFRGCGKLTMTEGHTRQPFIVRAATWVADARLGSTILTTCGAVGLALASFTGQDRRVRLPGHPAPGWVLAVAGLSTFFGIVLSERGRRGFTAVLLRCRLAEAELARSAHALEELARIELSLLAARFDYFSSERISLFAFADTHFELLARFSLNPSYRDAGRRRYDLGFGCLGQAWLHNRSAVVVMATRTDDAEAWLAEHVRAGMPRDRVTTIRMDVRTVVAVRVNDPRAGSSPLGVIVFESERARSDDGIGGRPSAVISPEDIYRRFDEAPRMAGLLAIFAELRGRATGPSELGH